jgi:hypothetical protein
MRRILTIGAVIIGLGVSSCTDDDEKETPSPAPPADTPSESAPAPNDPGALPPEFIDCMAAQGYDVKSSDDIHSAPPQVLQACFGALHQGGGAP